MPVFARVNVPWGINEAWIIDEDDSSKYINCFGPDDENPNDIYGIILWIDFYSSDHENKFTAGQVIEINGGAENLPVTDPTVIFRKP